MMIPIIDAVMKYKIGRVMTTPLKRNHLDLTMAEMRVADLVADGYSSRIIADKLMITEKVIKFHLTNIYRRLNLTKGNKRGHLIRIVAEARALDSKGKGA